MLRERTTFTFNCDEELGEQFRESMEKRNEKEPLRKIRHREIFIQAMLDLIESVKNK